MLFSLGRIKTSTAALSSAWETFRPQLRRILGQIREARGTRGNPFFFAKGRTMVKRYDIFKGDSTTAGGKVKDGAANDKAMSREQAYENDPVWCPACNSTGKIGCTGPRFSTKGPDGREAALSDDLCLCHCHPSPRLVPSQHKSYVDV